MIKLHSELKAVPFVVTTKKQGRIVIKAPGPVAIKNGIPPGIGAADAKTILPELKTMEYKEGAEETILTKLALWCLQFTPVAAVDLPDGLLLDISGCPHLWGGEQIYLENIIDKLKNIGFTARAAIADTIGTAWAIARYSKENSIIPPGKQLEAIKTLPPAALRLDVTILERMQKLGFSQVGNFIHMPHNALRRRFGEILINRINQALGLAIETLKPVQPSVIFQKRLPCLEPVKTRAAIDIALRTLLEQLCKLLTNEGKGLRTAIFKCYRTDGNIQEAKIGTNRPVRNVSHLLKLFEQKISSIKPDPGLELFLLEAPVTEELSSQQESLWQIPGSNSESSELYDLLDRITGKVGPDTVHRYLPSEHYWPERSFKTAISLSEKIDTDWRTDRMRPIVLLPQPERIEVTVPLPDYPPLLFIYLGKRHTVKKADGPERIESEWWITEGEHRDYYIVEDETGARFWLFRLGHYDGVKPHRWYLHGFFA